MNTLMSVFLVLTVALPLLAVATVPSVKSSLIAGRIGGAVSGLAFLLAVILIIWVSTTGPVSATLGTADRTIGGLHADRIVAVLLLLVTGLSAIVQLFAGRYLQGDVRSSRFFVGANLLTTATAAMVASVTLIGLGLAWTAAGLALLMLLGMYPGLQPAEAGQRRTKKAFFAGDLALWGGILLATLEWGNLDLRSLDGSLLMEGNGDAALTVVACLLVVAALSRSAQVPFQNWLPSTLAVPTPVSALLHAGVVNAGGILLVRTSPLFGESATATHLAFFAGATTAVIGTALMLSKPDVKGALAHSTTGQMGFMIMTCGLGAWAAVVFHLVAHGMFKASLFLGSGSAVRQHSRHRKSPPPPRLSAAVKVRAGLFSVTMPALALIACGVILYPTLTPATGALLAFAWATAAWATAGWLTRRPGATSMLIAAGATVAAGSIYVMALSASSAFLDPVVASAGQATVSPWWLTVLLPPLLLMSSPSTSSGIIGEFRKTAYVMSLGLAQVKPASPGRTRRLRFPTTTTGGLAAGSHGVRT